MQMAAAAAAAAAVEPDQTPEQLLAQEKRGLDAREVERENAVYRSAFDWDAARAGKGLQFNRQRCLFALGRAAWDDAAVIKKLRRLLGTQHLRLDNASILLTRHSDAFFFAKNGAQGAGEVLVPILANFCAFSIVLVENDADVDGKFDASDERAADAASREYARLDEMDPIASGTGFGIPAWLEPAHVDASLDAGRSVTRKGRFPLVPLTDERREWLLRLTGCDDALKKDKDVLACGDLDAPDAPLTPGGEWRMVAPVGGEAGLKCSSDDRFFDVALWSTPRFGDTGSGLYVTKFRNTGDGLVGGCPYWVERMPASDERAVVLVWDTRATAKKPKWLARIIFRDGSSTAFESLTMSDLRVSAMGLTCAPIADRDLSRKPAVDARAPTQTKSPAHDPDSSRLETHADRWAELQSALAIAAEVTSGEMDPASPAHGLSLAVLNGVKLPSIDTDAAASLQGKRGSYRATRAIAVAIESALSVCPGGDKEPGSWLWTWLRKDGGKKRTQEASRDAATKLVMLMAARYGPRFGTKVAILSCLYLCVHGAMDKLARGMKKMIKLGADDPHSVEVRDAASFAAAHGKFKDLRENDAAEPVVLLESIESIDGKKPGKATFVRVRGKVLVGALLEHAIRNGSGDDAFEATDAYVACVDGYLSEALLGSDAVREWLMRRTPPGYEYASVDPTDWEASVLRRGAVGRGGIAPDRTVWRRSTIADPPSKYRLVDYTHVEVADLDDVRVRPAAPPAGGTAVAEGGGSASSASPKMKSRKKKKISAA